MRGVKCFGLLLVFSIIFGLSLNASSDVNALQHDVRYLPLSSQTYMTDSYRFNNAFTDSGYQPSALSIEWDSSLAPDYSDFTNLNSTHFFYSHYVPSSGLCEYGNNLSSIQGTPQYSSAPKFVDNKFSYWIPSYSYFSGISSYPNVYLQAQCLQTSAFGVESIGIPHPDFNQGSLDNLPLVDRSPYYGLYPYYYDFDSAYVHDSAIDSESGIHYSSSLKMLDLTGGFSPNKFRSLELPIGRINSDTNVGSMTSGRPFELRGVFDFSGEGNYFHWSASTPRIRLKLSGLSSGVYRESLVDCSANLRSLEFNSFLQLEFSCSTDLEYSFDTGSMFVNLRFDLSNIDSSEPYIFDTNANWSFASAFIITDNDDTPGDTWGFAPTGNNLDQAPGSAQSLIPGDEDFFSSLTNLFSFNFINPFAPIFNLFTDQNSCAQIPTLAGMLHSQEIQVCPWFDSTTRNIVTPVLGLSSMMLLFGFAVRWLGSRSGNFIEDSEGFDSGGLHFQNKFRRNK